MIQSDFWIFSDYFFLHKFDYCFHAGNLVEFGNCTCGRVSEKISCKLSANYPQILQVCLSIIKRTVGMYILMPYLSIN